MKNYWKTRYIVLGLSLILTLLVFFTIISIILTEITILILLVIGAVSLINLFIFNMMIEKSKAMKEVYCCYKV